MLTRENCTMRHDGRQGSEHLTELTCRTVTSGSVWSRTGDSPVHSVDGAVLACPFKYRQRSSERREILLLEAGVGEKSKACGGGSHLAGLEGRVV